MTGSIGTPPTSAEWLEQRREQYRALHVDLDEDEPLGRNAEPPAADIPAQEPASEPLNPGRAPTEEQVPAAGDGPPSVSSIANEPRASRRPRSEPPTIGPSEPTTSAAADSVSATAPQPPAPKKLLPEERVRRLEALQQEVAECTRCVLHETRTNTVFARGNGSSGICFVGEGPGQDEDLEGSPFVGKAGQLLDRMIGAMGISRDDVYICNIVKCRPPKNRKPHPTEMRACRGYLLDQLDAIEPQVIVALGATAVEGLLGLSMGITRMRGQWRLYQGKIPVMPTFHPAYLLRQPGAKREVWEDLKAVLEHVGRQVPKRNS